MSISAGAEKAFFKNITFFHDKNPSIIWVQKKHTTQKGLSMCDKTIAKLYSTVKDWKPFLSDQEKDKISHYHHSYST